MSLRETFFVGGLRIDALSDGTYPRMLENLFVGAETAEWMRAAGLTHPRQTLPFNIGSFLIRDNWKAVLVDTGVGASYNARPGSEGWGGLILRLGEIGVRPDEIDVVLHTHLHWDHCGWDVDDSAGGVVTFRKARFLVAKAELEYWTGTTIPIDDNVRRTRSRIAPLLERGILSTFQGEFQVTQSLTTVPTPGHTPGHCSLLVASGGERLIIAGDAMYHPAHVEHPDWLPAVDVDKVESERSRHRLLALALECDAQVTSSHMALLTLGRIGRVRGGYRWVPVSTKAST